MSDTQINIEFRGKPGVAGVNWRGEYDEEAVYRQRDLVELDGTVYIASENPGDAAPPAEPWELFADTTAATQAAQQAAQSAADAEQAAENAASAAHDALVAVGLTDPPLLVTDDPPGPAVIFVADEAPRLPVDRDLDATTQALRGRMAADDVEVVVAFTQWGIDDGDGDPYFDPDGATTGAALLQLDPATGEPVLIPIGA